jgi:MoxR-like ATPase
MLKALVHYPSRQEERQILERYEFGTKLPVRQVVELEDLLQAREAVKQVHLTEGLRDYIVHLVLATREPKTYRMESLGPLIAFGASPRATIYLAQAAKAFAFLDGRGYVVPDDVKAVAKDVMRHRIIITYEAEAEDLTPDDIIERVLQGVAVP